MDPADDLVLLLARKTISAEEQARTRQILSAGVDWSRVVTHAQVHEVAPLLYRNLADLGFPGVPDEARGQLEALYKANALRATLLSGELTSLLGDAHAE